MKPRTMHKEDAVAIEMRKMLKLMKETVEENGGFVIDSGFGFNFPKPSRPRVYRDPDGKTKKTRGVRSNMHLGFLESTFPGEMHVEFY